MNRREDGPEILWSDRPPMPETFFEVWRPQPGETLHLVCLSPRIEGTDLHYVGGSSKPCIGPSKGCRICEGQKSHWEGYLFALNEPRKQIGIVGLTSGAVERCRELRAVPVLRGRKISYGRLEGSKNARCVLRLDRMHPRSDDLPDVPDLRTTLARLWGVPYETPAFDEDERGPDEVPPGLVPDLGLDQERPS